MTVVEYQTLIVNSHSKNEDYICRFCPSQDCHTTAS